MKSISSFIPLWQTQEWQDFQDKLGHKTHRVDDNLIIINPLFLGKSYGYIPRGPVFTSDQVRLDFWDDLKALVIRENLVFVRIDPVEAIILPDNMRSVLSHSVQPDTTLVLELQLSEEELLKQMKRKGRYNIKLAEKKGVTVKRAESQEQRLEFVQAFFSLLKETTTRDQFSGHAEGYYQTMLETIPQAEIFVAEYEGKALAAGIFVFQGDVAIYYYGASTQVHKELMAPYLLQWEAIKFAKSKGCRTYDFLGIAPEDAEDDHPWKGITSFKKKFGGETVIYPNPRDIIFKPFWYKIYQFMKFIQKKIK